MQKDFQNLPFIAFYGCVQASLVLASTLLVCLFQSVGVQKWCIYEVLQPFSGSLLHRESSPLMHIIIRNITYSGWCMKSKHSLLSIFSMSECDLSCLYPLAITWVVTSYSRATKSFLLNCGCNVKN